MQRKDPLVKIISFRLTANNSIHGLGDDGKMYIWDYQEGDFKLNAAARSY